MPWYMMGIVVCIVCGQGPKPTCEMPNSGAYFSSTLCVMSKELYVSCLCNYACLSQLMRELLKELHMQLKLLVSLCSLSIFYLILTCVGLHRECSFKFSL